MQGKGNGREVTSMAKKIVAMVLALSFLGILATAPEALAKRGRGGCPGEDPIADCHPED